MNTARPGRGRQSGHSEKSSAFWGYIEEAEQWEDAASDGIGL
ncbi:hypothetical protein [Streptomyces violascens]